MMEKHIERCVVIVPGPEGYEFRLEDPGAPVPNAVFRIGTDLTGQWAEFGVCFGCVVRAATRGVLAAHQGLRQVAERRRSNLNLTVARARYRIRPVGGDRARLRVVAWRGRTTMTDFWDLAAHEVGYAITLRTVFDAARPWDREPKYSCRRCRS
jgi:hypothetical protein